MERTAISRLLPSVFVDALRPGDPMDGLLAAMQGLIAPVERALGQLDAAFDPSRAAPPFCALLAHWVGLGALLPRDGEPRIPTGLGRLRMLVTHAAELARARGTVPGLRAFLEQATGLSGFDIEESVAGAERRPRPFHFRVTAPAGAARFRGFLELVIEREKPAYVTHELVFREPEVAGP